MSGWKFYIPGDGDTAEDAGSIEGTVLNAEDAAEMARVYEHDHQDGYERANAELIVAVTEAQADDLARLFHETYERLAPNFEYLTRVELAVPWEDVPESNRALMVATVKEVLGELRGSSQ